MNRSRAGSRLWRGVWPVLGLAALVMVSGCRGLSPSAWSSAKDASKRSASGDRRSEPADSSRANALPIAAPPQPKAEQGAPAPLIVAWARLRELGPQVLALSGWFLAMALGLVLVRLTQQWRTSFRNREWVLMPSSESQAHLWGLQRLAESVAESRESAQRVLLGVTDAVRSEVQASEASRKEFAVLREELDRRGAELEAARSGVDLWHRRAVLRAITRAVEMIRDDRERQRDLQSTLDGLLVELEDCLQENRVSLHFPEVGAPFGGDTTIDLAQVVREPSPDEQRRGTIAAVERPAYVARRLDGKQEVLLAARVKVFV